MIRFSTSPRSTFRALSLVALIALASGCEQAGLNAAPVIPRDTVVIDLDEVAAKLGRAAEFKEMIAGTTAELNSRFNSFATGLRAKLEAQREKTTENPSPEAADELRRLTGEVQAELRRGQAVARQQVQKFQAELVAKFRAEVQPFAEFVARERGARVVLLRANMLWHDPDSDITAAVIEAMQTATPDATEKTQ
ncbi:MAG: OmpH family outer membrane protein [Pseudomonadota bacterium]